MSDTIVTPRLPLARVAARLPFATYAAGRAEAVAGGALQTAPGRTPFRQDRQAVVEGAALDLERAPRGEEQEGGDAATLDLERGLSEGAGAADAAKRTMGRTTAEAAPVAEAAQRAVGQALGEATPSAWEAGYDLSRALGDANGIFNAVTAVHEKLTVGPAMIGVSLVGAAPVHAGAVVRTVTQLVLG
jgi:hypothetical protein